jgi:hypothetical protein
LTNSEKRGLETGRVFYCSFLMAPGREINLDELRQVLLQVLDMEVSQTNVGKPFIGIRLGGGQKIKVEVETEFWLEVVEYDFEFDIGDDWRIVKSGREVSRSDIFPIVLGPIKRGPSLASLLHNKISTITIKPNLDLIIKFADNQELIVSGLGVSKHEGREYINWRISTLDTVYSPLPNGLVKAMRRGSGLRPTRLATDL